jgi:prophage regulatory protein
MRSNLIRLARVVEKTGRSKPTIYRDQTFPKPVKIGARAVAWVESEIDDWIAAQIAKSRGEKQVEPA